ncbi:AlbA family DNA-binding domain-containing protein [Fluviicola taffensis]|uniref:Putative transcriptional regulator n=1 Tax=Fluviicola taffensis (strain DSM 16823 / NCIMB 13979 / RW262) TaxID=755732 RepID=F2IBX2_FLUTR|nr:RNA-binding domain-containing protein [Fluviicola taffensis]AEA42200.1 putative transcriptional regulator [Fluviicola taffensis DSM 16823]
MQSVKQLIKEGEHQQQDFKFRIDDSKKIARTLVAFANTDGGRLLIGVKDNGKITGIDPTEEIHMIEAAVDMYSKPKLEFQSRVWQEDMKLVLEITIEKNTNRPVFALDEEGKWKAYVRRKDHTLLANKILLNVWKHERFDQKIPEKIGAEETELLQIIAQNPLITLSKIYRFSSLDKSHIDRLLPLFICWDLISMEMNENGTFYRVIEN